MDGTDSEFILELPKDCLKRLGEILAFEYSTHPLDSLLIRLITLIYEQTENCIKSIEQLTKDDLGDNNFLVDIWTPRGWDR